MVNTLKSTSRITRITPSRVNFIQKPGEELLRQLSGKPGSNLAEKAAALSPDARQVLMPILESLDAADAAADADSKPALIGQLDKAIEGLDRSFEDGIEDGHYAEIRTFADSRYDGAPKED